VQGKPHGWSQIVLVVLAASALAAFWGNSQLERSPIGWDEEDVLYALWASGEIDRSNIGVDDANIFFTYGKHLAEGHGLVWNVGGERVEGYSSTLWMLTAGATYRLGLPTEGTLFLLNVILVATALTLLVFELERQIGPHRDSAVPCSFESGVVLAWTFLVPGYVLWTCLSLLDSGLWSAILITATVLVAAEARSEAVDRRRFWGLAALIVATLLGRPEGMLWAGAFAALYGGVLFLRGDGVRVALRRFATLVGVYAFTLAGITAFRLAYFGYPLPNTYYAKMSPELGYNLTTGWRYFWSFIESNWLLWIAVPAALWGLLRLVALRARQAADTGSDRLPDLPLAVVSCVVLIGLAVPVLEGGDHFRLYRFFQPIWPLLVLPSLALAEVSFVRWTPQAFFASLRRLQWLVLVLLAAVFAVANATTWNDLSTDLVQLEFRLATRARAIGENLNRTFAETGLPSVGVVVAGGVGLTYEGEVIDLMGLNLVEMAHEPGSRVGIKNHAAFNKNVFWRLQPDIMLPQTELSERRIPNYEAMPSYAIFLKGLPSDPDFQGRYRPAAVRRKGRPGDVFIIGIYRRDYLRDLVASGVYDVFSPA
jgi:arabinofuranosyltransferase